MPHFSRLRRQGRLLDWLIIPLLLVVFVGLGVYHDLRQGGPQENGEKLGELAQQTLAEPRSEGSDWPQWRGPNRDGVSLESDLLADWPIKGPKLVWEKPAGEGFASVSVVNGRVFALFQIEGNEVVVCMDAQTGKDIWRFSYPCPFKNDYGNGPRATPTVDGDLVYTVGAKGMLHCLNAFTDNPAGVVVWKKDLLAEFHAPEPKWGTAFSPLVEGAYLSIQPGGPDGNALAALNKYTGNVIWKTHDDPAGYSSPIAATLCGQRQILFFTGARLVGVNPDTGAALWDYAWVTDFDCNIATPIVVQDYVFISSGYGRGCALLKIDKAEDRWQATVVYKNRRMRNHFSSCVRDKDSLYGFDDSTLTCMNFRTGEVQWQKRGFNKGSVLLAGDHLIIYGENGIVALAEANPKEYRERARFEFSSEPHCWSVPVVANGRLYVRDQKKIACFDVKAAK